MITCESSGSLLALAACLPLAVDAFTVAVADLSGGAIVATTEPRDLKRLAMHATRVIVADIELSLLPFPLVDIMPPQIPRW